VTRPPTLLAGPEEKDQLWWFGSLLIGWVVLLWFFGLFFGNPLGIIGWTWQTFLLLLVGWLCSIPYGRAWMQGKPMTRPHRRPLPTATVEGPEGSTFIFVGTPGRRRLTARDLSPFWWIVYTLFIRFPAAVGDFFLVLGWRGWARLQGVTWGGNGFSRWRERGLDSTFSDEQRRETEERF
jgi:hypothetical protein